ncbi:MAG: hypothetical protein WCS03_18725, partial [Bacteroidota bacterium]
KPLQIIDYQKFQRTFLYLNETVVILNEGYQTDRIIFILQSFPFLYKYKAIIFSCQKSCSKKRVITICKYRIVMTLDRNQS